MRLSVCRLPRPARDGSVAEGAAKSAIAKVIRYALKRWEALLRYCDEGALAIDNNPVERTLRGVTLGRRNVLFVGNEAGGERAAAIHTLSRPAA